MSPFRKLLLSLLLVSLTGSAFGAGTFASFTASTTNATSTFATGSIVLSNKVAAGTACFSTGIASPGTGSFSNGNVNGACDLVMNQTVKKPGDSTSVDIELVNGGDLDAATLKLEVDAAPNDGGSVVCVTGDAASTAFHGNGDLCGTVAATGLQLKLQEWPDAAHTVTPADADYRCHFDSDGANDDACGATGGLFTAFDDFGAAPLSISGGLQDVAAAPANSRWFTLTVTMPNGAAGAENAVMGRKVEFKLTWTIEQ